jgi:hypothetical protein
MADLSDINSAGSTKIIGSDLTGVETTPMAVNSDGSINVAVTSIIETEIKNDSGNPIPISSSDVTATGTIAAITQNVAISTIGKSVVDIQVTGTYTGALTPQITVNGTTWVALSTMRNVTTNAIAATVVSAAQGIYQAEISASTEFRIIANAAVTGTATITLRASLAKGPGSSVAQAISAASLPLPAGASTSALQTTGNTSLATIVTNTNGLSVAQGSTTASQVGGLVQGAVTTAAPTYTTGQTNPLSLNTSGALRVDGSGVTQPISGTVTANQGTSPWVVSGTINSTSTQLNQDAFALGDYKHIYDIDPTFLDKVSNGGAVTFNVNEACATLSTTSDPLSDSIHQTRSYHHYQPGKSQLILSSVCLGYAQRNVTKRTGYFDDRDGIYFEQVGSDTSDATDNGTLNFVIRSFVSGTALESDVGTYHRRVPQSEWNIDKCNGAGGTSNPSGFNINTSTTQLFHIDFQWLGVGRVRCGFVHNGSVIIAHEYYHSNVLPEVYMANPNLPVRCQIFNTGITTGGSMNQICSTVASEGGFAEVGTDFSVYSEPRATLTPGQTKLPLMAIRLKNSFKGYPNRINVRPTAVSFSAQTESVVYEIGRLQSVTDLSTTIPGGLVWVSAGDSSGVEYCVNATDYIVAGMDRFASGFAPAGSSQNSLSPVIVSPLTAAKKNTISQNIESNDSEIIVILVSTVYAGNIHADVACSIQWREVY